MNTSISTQNVPYSAEISIFKNVFTPSDPRTEQVLITLGRIKCGRWKAVVEKVRETVKRHGRDSAPTKAAKKHVEVITLAGKFSRRDNNSLEKHSGLIAIDLDKVGEIDITRKTLERNPHVLSCWKSITGTGLWFLVPVTPTPINDEEHKAAREAVVNIIERENGIDLSRHLDRGVKDVSRACCVSHDPELRVNQQAVPLTWKTEGEAIESKSVLSNGGVSAKPSREELREILHHIPTHPGYEVWIKVISGVYDCVGKSITLEDAVELLKEWSPEKEAGEYAEKMRNPLNRISVGTLIRMARLKGWQGTLPIPDGEFGEFVEIAKARLAEASTEPTKPPLEHIHPAIHPPDSIIADCFKLLQPELESADAYLDGALSVIIAALLGRRVYFMWGDKKEYPNDFAILVGPPGDRKSTAIKAVERLAREILPSNAFMSDTFSPESLFDEFSEDEGGRPDKVWIVDDANPTLSYWRTPPQGERIAARFLNLFDCCSLSENFRQNKKKGEKGSGIRHVDETSTSVIFGATFQIACFQGQQVQAGIARRFRYYVAERLARTIALPKPRDRGATNEIVERLRRLLTLKGEVRFSPEAETMWIQHQVDNRAQMDQLPGGHEARRHRLSGAPIHVLKLAMRFEAARWARGSETWTGIIRQDTLDYAIRHHAECLRSADYLDERIHADSEGAEAEILLSRIRRDFPNQGGIFVVTRSQLTHKYCPHGGRAGGWKPKDLYHRYIPKLIDNGSAILLSNQRREIYAFAAEGRQFEQDTEESQAAG